jgi:hypothetical protein
VLASAAGCIAPARIAEVDAAQIARLLTSPIPESAAESAPMGAESDGGRRSESVSTEHISTELPETRLPDAGLPEADGDNLSPPRGMHGIQVEPEREFDGITEVIAQPLPRSGGFEEVAPGPIVAPSVGTMPMFRDIRDINAFEQPIDQDPALSLENFGSLDWSGLEERAGVRLVRQERSPR